MKLRRLTFLLFLLLVSPAQAALTFGVVPAPGSMIQTAAQASAFGEALGQQLGEAVTVRTFAQQDVLAEWMTRFRVVDLALVSAEFIASHPDGAFFTFAGEPGHEQFVARQGVSLEDRERYRQGLEALTGETLPAASGPVSPLAAGATEAGAGAPPEGQAQTPETEASQGGDVREGFEGPSPVNLEADQMSYDKADSVYRAEGQVRLQKGPLTLHADQLVWDEATSDASAKGNVRLYEPAGNARASELEYNLETKLGRMSDGRVFFKDRNFHLAGQEVEKLGEEEYRVKDGIFTTCDAEVPAWKFGASQLDVSLGGYARAKHALFYLYDVPVLYFPYMMFPVKKDRESGFLMPGFGVSKKRGLELSLAYYQVIDRNQDATLFVDYLSDFGIGKGLEYRYIFDRDNEGQVRLYHISGLHLEKDDPASADIDKSDRFALEWQHAGSLPHDWFLGADVQYVSERDYFEEFGKVAGEYNKDETSSVIYLNRSNGRLTFTGQLKYIQDLEKDDDTTLQRLPELKLNLLEQPIGDSPFYFGLQSQYTYFWREEGLKGQRLTVRPSLSAVFNPGDYLEIVPEVGYRERLYATSHEGPGYEREGLYDFTTTVSTNLARVFDVEGESLKKIRHSIEPEVVYAYIPDDEQGHLPEFDSLDRIDAENTVTYALTNRFTARLEPDAGNPEYLEFLYLRLSETYDIGLSRHDREKESGVDAYSDTRGELILRPSKFSYIDLDTRYNRRDRLLNEFDARAGLRDGGADGNSLSVEYSYERDETEYLAGTVSTSLLDPFFMSYQHRYDFKDQVHLEKVFNVEYRAQCWSIFLSLRDRLEDQEYFVTFSLSGLGRVAGLGGSLGGGDD